MKNDCNNFNNFYFSNRALRKNSYNFIEQLPTNKLKKKKKKYGN